jgi:hypothetical protein
MAKTGKKKKFSNNQIVVFRYSDRKLVGKICLVRPVGKKKFLYDVMCEDGRVYQELYVDIEMNHCIDTYLTRLFYKKYDIDENGIPEFEDDENPIVNVGKISEPVEDDEHDKEEDGVVVDTEEILFGDEDMDVNW